MDGGTSTDGGEPKASAHLKPEELVAKAIAPVKREYLRPPPLRPCSSSLPSDEKDGTASNNDKSSSTAVVVKEKKSKRQLKRERQQEQKSVLNICPEIAKTGNVNACCYDGKCRFSHDLEAFLAQKPADIQGDCPFNSKESCPYGMACRFSGTHKTSIATETSNVQKKISEMNGLNKDVQKLLWKNKMSFPRADAELKRLGLSVKDNAKARKVDVDQEEGSRVIPNGLDAQQKDDNSKMTCDCVNEVEDFADSSTGKDSVDDTSAIDDTRPLKKARNTVDEKSCSSQMDNGITPPERELEAARTEPLDITTDPSCSPEFVSSLKLNAREKKIIDFRGKLYLAPLTTVGNLPFRRVCKFLGADITCGEMAMCTNLLQGQASEWALLRRHSSEDLFGVQICGSYPDTVARTVDLVESECTVDFIDINMGCPIDIVVNRGAGSSLLTKPLRMKNVIHSASCTVDKPLTIKVRTGYFEGRNRIDSLIADISNWGASAVTIHGRSRQQRYSKLADWDYIYQCAKKAPDVLQVLGNGDIFSYTDWNNHISECPELSTCMIARGALIKPWIFTEIKEQRHWDITSGVETTRHFLLEWLSYTYRYVPVGILDVIPQRLNWRPPCYFGRDDLETLMASDSAADWIRLSEMLLGKVPSGFTFAPKHKSNAYDRAENG
ncbi:tRNA-dihydrouridine(47) synthase [NAD(P)(+)]-like isoform X2 [Magnolia sinica]|uniref:tRNA-dihydrouridine(47) synthase [NAD(P)(+)]-like isoform X2 n=1 Tax=Magnolia sinica TaxID=86752 RepID=UPI002658607C|nr:tRNA-dihydrouridine(47) synthase [NAD(P)(+)]-like isoform X2 [Magnolia sinica]